MYVVPNLVFQNNLYVSHFFMTFFGGCSQSFLLFRIGGLSKVNYTISQENFDTKTGLKRISLENSEINP